MADLPNYPDEVLDAMRAQGLLQEDEPPIPEKQVRYHITVEQTFNGAADPATVAELLRGLADQLTEGNQK